MDTDRRAAKKNRSHGNEGWGCGSVGRALDLHAASAGSIPQCSKFFSHRVNYQCRLSYGARTPLCAIICIDICVQVKDPVENVRVQWIMETLKPPACTVGVTVAAGFPRGRQPKFSKVEIPLKQYSCRNVKKMNKSKNIDICHLLQRPCYQQGSLPRSSRQSDHIKT